MQSHNLHYIYYITSKNSVMYLLHKLPTFINSPHSFQKFLHTHPLKCYLIYKTYNINERLSIVACRTCSPQKKKKKKLVELVNCHTH